MVKGPHPTGRLPGNPPFYSHRVEEKKPFRVRYEIPLTLLPFVAGLATAIPLWGERAKPIFFATAAEVIALGAVALVLEGRLFRVSGPHGPRRGNYAMATQLIAVGVGLGFAFGALARDDGGADPHLAMTAGGLAMGISAFAIQAFFGSPGAEDD